MWVGPAINLANKHVLAYVLLLLLVAVVAAAAAAVACAIVLLLSLAYLMYVNGRRRRCCCCYFCCFCGFPFLFASSCSFKFWCGLWFLDAFYAFTRPNWPEKCVKKGETNNTLHAFRLSNYHLLATRSKSSGGSSIGGNISTWQPFAMVFSRFKSKLGFPQLLISRTPPRHLPLEKNRHNSCAKVVVAWL